MGITVKKSKLCGNITAIASKSVLHRQIICAALCNGTTVINNVIYSDDVNATLSAVSALGARVEKKQNSVIIEADGCYKENVVIDCGESGSTLRFLIPVVVALGVKATFLGHGRLPQRTISEYLDIFKQKNVEYLTPEGKFLPLQIKGKLMPGQYSICGNVSSQYITGLLIALCVAQGESVLTITTELESAGYVDITVDILKSFGASIRREGNTFYISKSELKCGVYNSEGDFSQAAFFLCAGALGADIWVDNLNLDSHQGDKKIIEILQKFGATTQYNENKIRVKRNELNAIEIDASNIVDLVPIVSLVAAFAKGQTQIYNVKRLRIKESDRVYTTISALSSIGADIYEGEDCIIINGKNTLDGGKSSSFNDHRIAMMLAIAGAFCEKSVTIENENAVNKSYPDFFEHLKMLGGSYES